MGAGHFHAHDHDHATSDDGARSGLWKALIITAAFMGVEAVGGWWSNSLALMTDALHMATDVGGLGLSLFALWFARRGASSTMSYGYQRAEILGALVSGVLIWILAVGLVWEGIERLRHPQAVQGVTVIGIAFLGLLVNLISLRFLHGHHEKQINVRAAYLHVLGDLLGSVGALVSGVLIWAFDWRIADPIVTLIFAALIFRSSWGLLREAVEILMESVPRNVDYEAVRQALLALPGVNDVHDLHIWSLSSGKPALSVHLVARAESDVLHEAQHLLGSRFAITHTTIQIDPPESDPHSHCANC